MDIKIQERKGKERKGQYSLLILVSISVPQWVNLFSVHTEFVTVRAKISLTYSKTKSLGPLILILDKQYRNKFTLRGEHSVSIGIPKT